MEKNYQIIITRKEPNPKNVAELEARAIHGRHYEEDSYPAEITTSVLMTEVTEQQFKTIQREILKVFE